MIQNWFEAKYFYTLTQKSRKHFEYDRVPSTNTMVTIGMIPGKSEDWVHIIYRSTYLKVIYVLFSIIFCVWFLSVLDKLNKSVEGSVAMNTQLKSKICRKMKDLEDKKRKKRQ